MIPPNPILSPEACVMSENMLRSEAKGQLSPSQGFFPVQLVEDSQVDERQAVPEIKPDLLR